MVKTGIKMVVGCLLLPFVLVITGCGGGDDSSVNATPGVYKFTNAMLSGNTYNINGDISGKYIFHTDGTANVTYTSGTDTKSWAINSLGQLVLSSGGNTQVLTPASNSTTVIPCNIQFIDPARPANNGNGGITLTLVTPTVTYNLTNAIFSGKTFTFSGSDGNHGTIKFNANNTVTITPTGEASFTSAWLITSSGQLKLTHSDGTYDVLSATNNSSTNIVLTDEYTDPLHPTDNGTSTMTITLVS